MKTFLVTIAKTIEVEAEDEYAARDKMNDWLMENDPEANIDFIEESN